MNFYKENDTNKVITEDEIKNYNMYDFKLLKANTTDGALEKHVPSCEIVDGKIEVKIGEVEHPMTEEHYIMWIAQVVDSKIIKKELKPGDSPKAQFEYKENSEIYAYCNLHGLWKTVVE